MRVYRPAVVSDGARLLEIAKQSHTKIKELPSVTWVAEEDGRVEAAIGLDFEDRFVIAGPLLVAPEAKQKPFMVVRLIDLMEDFVRKAGVESYLFCTAVANARWNRFCGKIGLDPYCTRNGRHWYVRRLSHVVAQG